MYSPRDPKPHFLLHERKKEHFDTGKGTLDRLTSDERELGTHLCLDPGKACFTAGVPIRTPDGWRTIEALKVGDKVLSRDEFNANGEVVAKIVEEVFVRFAEVRKIKVNSKEIGTTAEHPFYAWERGWVPARELQVGDTLLCEDGVWRAVEEVGETGEWQTV